MSAGATEVCPWDVDPALKTKRLVLLARLAVETRAQALAEADREAGDTNWGIGCKAHERFAHAVAKLAASSDGGWLRVHRDGLSFVSFIEGVAVRAYHGAADRPHVRHVYAAQLESHREAVDPRQLALPFSAAPVAELSEADRWAWLMAVETDDEGRALRVVFFQANAVGARRYSWVAPIPTEGPDAPRPGEARKGSSRGAAAPAMARRRPTQLVALV